MGIKDYRRLLKIQSVIAIHLMRLLTNFDDFRFKGTATAASRIREDTIEERYAKRFCFKLGKNVTETCGMLQTAFRPSCMNRASVFEWHKRFKEGRESMRDDEWCGRSKEVSTPELIGQRVRVTMLRF